MYFADPSNNKIRRVDINDGSLLTFEQLEVMVTVVNLLRLN